MTSAFHEMKKILSNSLSCLFCLPYFISSSLYIHSFPIHPTHGISISLQPLQRYPIKLTHSRHKALYFPPLGLMPFTPLPFFFLSPRHIITRRKKERKKEKRAARALTITEEPDEHLIRGSSISSRLGQRSRERSGLLAARPRGHRMTTAV